MSEETKLYEVDIEWSGSYYDTVEAESMEEAYDLARDLAVIEVPFECDDYSINVYEA